MLEFWHFDRNMEVSPEQVGIYSRKRVWWQHVCPTTGEEHEWQAKVQAVCRIYPSEERAPCPICRYQRTRKHMVKADEQLQADKRLSAA